MPSSGALRVLAFEPFDAGSHRAVRESIGRHSRHSWTWLTRPGRAWKWRMRVGAAEMIEAARGQGLLEQRFDLVFATSLMSASDLRAMLPDELRTKPLILSMHENQAAYPEGHAAWQGDAERSVETPRDVQFALTNLASILAADRVIWNSRSNKDSFINGIESILRHAPDLDLTNIGERIEGKSQVIWPPVEPCAEGWGSNAGRVLHNPAQAGQVVHGTIEAQARPARTPNNPIRVVWPHRWEHDKGPDLLLEVARRYSEPLNLRWTILGERYRRIPTAMEEFTKQFAERIDHIGFEPVREAYWRRLASCDWVLSTARHEFFGLAVAEALLAGCMPWLPDRLSYVEILPPEAKNLSPMNAPHQEAWPAIRRKVAEHLMPAIATVSVSHIDDAIEAAVRPRRVTLD
jgi:glycosyltransferase involved in cell wall biosynthesis